MSKIAIFARFYFAVFPQDVFENRRHLHVLDNATSKVLAKIWIGSNGEKNVSVDHSCLSNRENQQIIEVIENHWSTINQRISNVFDGKKMPKLKLK